MSINELQDEVIAEFSDFDDWMDRYQLLIDLGNEQEPLEEKYKTEQNLIEGYQSITFRLKNNLTVYLVRLKKNIRRNRI